MRGILGQVTVVDVILLALLVGFALEGLRRGLIRGVLDLVGLAIAGALGLYGYPVAGAWLSGQTGLSSSLADLAGFFGIFVLTLIAFALATALLVRLIGPAFLDPSLRLLNSLAGLAPGLLKGVVFSGLVLRAVTLLPFGEDVKTEVGHSRVAGRVGDASTYVLPYVESAFNQIAEEALRFVPPIHTGERRDLAVPRGITIWTDPASEDTMLRLLNQERVLAGVPPLVADSRIRDVARSQSEEMFRLAYFAHDSPLTGTPFDRLRRAGIPFAVAGENLAYAPTVEAAHRGLMESPDHRRNILAPEFRRVGIGAMQSGLWGRMFTQDFTD